MVEQNKWLVSAKMVIARRLGNQVADVRQISNSRPDPENPKKNCSYMIVQTDMDQWDCVMFTPFDLSESGMDNMPEPLDFSFKEANDCLNEYFKEQNIDSKDLSFRFHQLDIIAFNDDQATVRFHLNISEEENLPPNLYKEAILTDITKQNKLDVYYRDIPTLPDLLDEDKENLLECLEQLLERSGYRDIEDWITKNPDKCGLPENQKQNSIPKHDINRNTDVANKAPESQLEKKI